MNGRALLAWNLLRLRLERGISQERLAADAQVDRAYISELENRRGNPTVDFLDKLATCLAVPLFEFFREPEPGTRRPKSLPSGRKPRRKPHRTG
ncbi:MAG: helix-turn-helix transcriptional regulator [Alphaproteobacteria bacterium]|nr:helix-turn-helix transcriptional regulator [Alphaproteobacteria bacterium]MDE2493572.1 helix-turn-helix transcriptional regulator [Alphaproteobacteria bacterium]